MDDDPEWGPFDGVFYTRGSFSKGKPPCFFDALGAKNEIVKLSFGLSECQIAKSSNEIASDKFINITVIVQVGDVHYSVKGGN